MSAHTTGKLHASQYLDDGRLGILNADNEIIVGVASKLTEADARRLAACWNACDGIDTDGAAIKRFLMCSVFDRARELVASAAAAEVVLTITQRPLLPLAMGNYETVVSLRPARVMAEKGDAK